MRQNVLPNLSRAFCMTLLILTVGSQFACQPLSAQALSPQPRFVQARSVQAVQPNHTLRLQPTGFSMVQIEIDGVVTFRGMLWPNEVRQWQGASIVLTIQNSAPVAITLDNLLHGTVAKQTQRATVRWPATVPLPIAGSPSAGLSVTGPSITGPATAESSSAGPATESIRPPALYTVQPGDTLFLIAEEFGSDVEVLLATNQLESIDLIYVGTTLAIPGSDGTLPTPRSTLLNTGSATNRGDDIWRAREVPLLRRASVPERLTTAAQQASEASPFHQTTWLTYYGRPTVAVMGILGEYSVDDLVPLLKAEAAAYDDANGATLDVLPAFHLVYGMAAKAPGDGSHLIFLEDAVVERYIERAEAEGFAVILDIQIGALTPAEALAFGLPWLDYANVHLALDPEFAMAHVGQLWPGDPIGFVTAAQVNEAQETMQRYLVEQEIPGQRVLLVHQFLDTMIENKADLDWTHDRLALTISADGWGGPWGKITKYNLFMDAQTHFTAFKLFYRWDEPLMTPRETLGVDGYGEQGFIEVTPNLIMYQ